MKSSNLNYCALSVWVSALLLAGCGGLQTASLPTSTHFGQAGVSGSKDLVYVGYLPPCHGSWCVSTGTVNVYTFPEGRFVGSWAGAKDSVESGECADGVGNIFVTYAYFKGTGYKGEVLEFAHGGTSPVAALKVGSGVPAACSVDSTSGDLAVVSGNDLMVFRNASGSPAVYYGPGVSFSGVAYDDKDNIFVDGASGRYATFAELAKGGHELKVIALRLHTAGEVQWDGQYVTLGFGIHCVGLNGLRIDRLDVRGSSAKVVGVTQLKGASKDRIIQYLFKGKQIVVAWDTGFCGCPPDGCGPQPGGVGIGSYPTGRMKVKSITHGGGRLQELTGVAVSLGQRL